MKLGDVKKAGRLAGRLAKLLACNRRGLRHVVGTALNLTDEVIEPHLDLTLLEARALESLLNPVPLAVEVCVCQQPGYSISLVEAMTLATLTRHVRASKTFEFGTHRGVSTSQIAANLAPGGRIFTLDLPDDDRRTSFELDIPGDVTVSRWKEKGDLIPAHLLERVIFLKGDSANFDTAPYHGQMDLVFVDAAHSYAYVTNDSVKGWAMLRPGGLLLWHDCRPQTPDVVRYLLECPFQPFRISGTTIACAIKPAA